MILFLLLTYVFSLTTVIEAGNSVLISSLGQYTNIEYNYSVTGPYPVSAYMFNNNQNYIDCINNNYINCVYDNLGSVVNKTNAKIANFYCGDNCYLMLYNHYQYFVKIDINTSYCAKNPNPDYNDDDDQDCYNKYSIYFDIFFVEVDIRLFVV